MVEVWFSFSCSVTGRYERRSVGVPAIAFRLFRPESVPTLSREHLSFRCLGSDRSSRQWWKCAPAAIQERFQLMERRLMEARPKKLRKKRMRNTRLTDVSILSKGARTCRIQRKTQKLKPLSTLHGRENQTRCLDGLLKSNAPLLQHRDRCKANGRCCSNT